MANATVETVTLKTAACPECGCKRLFYIGIDGIPIPFDISKAEIKEAAVTKTIYTPALLTKKVIVVTGAGWQVDEHKDKWVELLDELDQPFSPPMRGKIESNTDEQLTLSVALRSPGSHKEGVVSTYTTVNGNPVNGALNKFRIETKLGAVGWDSVKSAFWDNSQFICEECQTTYEIP